VLAALGAGAVGLAVGACAGQHGRSAHAVRGHTAAHPSHPPSPSPSPSPSPTTPVRVKPVYTLADFRADVPGLDFGPDTVALTIDDGPHPVWTPKVLDLLAHHGVPATFCMIGNQVRGHEVTARSVAAAGHQIANHTWSHPIGLNHNTAADMVTEIHRAQEKIVDTTGHTPTLFRSPGGDWSPALFQQVAASGMTPIDWSDDPRDWSKPGIQHIVDTMVACQPGQILLCHDGGGDRSQTYAALQQVIPAVQARGLTFVPLV
jgi:peptidoglycan/xylan/chitin deacetylase (PgdA/CDA1 family)